MVYAAEDVACRAEEDATNSPGYCLQWCREKAGIDPLYGDATTAWANTNDRHPGDRNPPRGALPYWTGGSHGYGHIAVSIGGGKIRSTDAGGSGRVATVSLGWVETHWGLPYAGWAWDVNEITIPHEEGSDDDMTKEDWEQLRKIVREEVNNARPNYVTSFLAGEVDDRDPSPTTVKKALRLAADNARAETP